MSGGWGVLPIPLRATGGFHGAVHRVSESASGRLRRRVAAARRRPSAIVSGVMVIALLAAGAVYAITSDDYPVTDASLHDHGVWVTDLGDSSISRFNTSAVALESLKRVPTGAFDVVQDDATVLVLDQSGSLREFDPVSGKFGDSIPVPPGSKLDVRGGTVALLDPAGTVVVRPAAQAGELRTGTAPSIRGLGPNASMAVGADGTVYAVPATGGTMQVLSAGATKPSRVGLEGFSATSAQVSAVGDQPVVLDGPSGQLRLPSGQVITPAGGHVVLQQPGPDTGEVLLANDTQLVAVDLATRRPSVRVTKVGTSDPAPPVAVSGCEYGAWTIGLSYTRWCAGRKPYSGISTEKAQDGDHLVYRVNHGEVVLNNVRDGQLLRPERQDITKKDWNAAQRNADALSPQPGEQEDKRTETSNQTSKQNHAPVAVPDDMFNTRADQSVIVHVLDNDYDTDGDILSVEPELSDPTGGTATVVENGQAVQVVPRPGASSVTFGYAVSDPRGGHSRRVKVTVRVIGSNEENPPVQRTGVKLTAKVEAGHRAQLNLLDAFYDPENDPLHASVEPGSGAQISPSGLLTYTDSGHAARTRVLAVQVADARGQQTQAQVSVDVLGSARPPVTHPDVVAGAADATITADPLANDVDLGNEPLHLARVTAPAGITAGRSPDLSRVEVSGGQPGKSYVIRYQAANADAATTGLLRVDVLPADAPAEPVAVDDAAFVPASGVTDVDLLANDYDPNAQVLVVQQVTPGDAAVASGVRFAVLEHRVLRVWAKARLTKPVQLTYQVSNGGHDASAAVTVSTPEAAPADQAPVAVVDAATAQAGAVIDVPVLANDSDPDGDALTLGALDGVPAGVVAAVRGSVVRVQAPQRPGTVAFSYSVSDPAGQTASAQVLLSVRADPVAQNSPPTPPDLQGRAFAGEVIRLPLPPGGLDPDGDSVMVLGATTTPAKGTVSVENGSTLVYRALAGAQGTDTFSYQVADARGQTATATARVGVVARPDVVNLAPVAVDDSIRIRPGRTVSVRVLDNDLDPDGDPVQLRTGQKLASTPAGAGIVTQVKDRIEISAAGMTPFAVRYTATDGRGGESPAYLSVQPDAEAPLLAPVARDDVLASQRGDRLTAGVLANDDDPDGRAADLTVTPIGPHAAAAVVTGGTLSITRQRAPMVVGYRVTDRDGLSAEAFVWVPGTANHAPQLRHGVQARAGQPTTIRIADVISDPDGDPVRLSGPVSAVRGQVQANGDSVRYTAPPQAGDDAISVTVTDDPRGQGSPATTRIDVPVQVTSPTSQPRVQDTRVDLQIGDEPRTVGLRSFVSEPGAGPETRYTFTADGAAGGVVSAQVKDQTLVLTPRKPGRTTLKVTARNETTGRSGSGTVTVQVMDAQSVPPAPYDFAVEGEQGKPVTLPWRAHVVAAPSAKLAVVPGSVHVSPDGAGAVSIGADALTFTSQPNWTGRAEITYAVQDSAASGPARQPVPARAGVVIRGLPGKPGVPEVVRLSGASVTLSWAPAATGGSPITGYTVTTAPSGRRTTCPLTTCTLDGIETGTPVTFTVHATNAVGDGLEGDASAPLTVENLPDVPAAPSAALVPGGTGGRLDVTWVAVKATGGAAIRYDVVASPSGQTQTTTGTTAQFSGLENGTAYTFTVRACVGAICTDYSPSSVPLAPAAPPDAPVIATGVYTSPSTVQFTWAAPADNGSSITGYTIKDLNPTTGPRTWEVTGTTASVVIAYASYDVSMQAHSRAGDSAFGPESRGNYDFTPDVVGLVTAKPADGAATLSFSASKNADFYRYRVAGSDTDQVLPTDRTVTGLKNGTSYSFEVIACGTKSTCAAASDRSNLVIPFGKPFAPTNISAVPSTGDSAIINVSACKPASNGRAVESLQFRKAGGSWAMASVDPHGDCPMQPITLTSYGTTNFEVRSVDETGSTGDDLATASKTLTQPTYTWIWGTCNDASTTPDCVADYRITFNTLPLKGFGEIKQILNTSGSCDDIRSVAKVSIAHGGVQVTGIGNLSSGTMCGFQIYDSFDGSYVPQEKT